jgi:hypothetical protein
MAPNGGFVVADPDDAPTATASATRCVSPERRAPIRRPRSAMTRSLAPVRPSGRRASDPATTPSSAARTWSSAGTRCSGNDVACSPTPGDDRKGAHLGNGVEVGFNSKVELGATLGNGVTIGESSLIGKLAVIGNDVTIGDFVVVGLGARVGAGATIEDGATLGKRATVQAGAVVPAGITVPDQGTFP